MKTAIALFVAALSVAALSTKSSAQKLMPTAGMKAPKLMANIGSAAGPGGSTFMTGSAGTTGWREVNGLEHHGADTSFGTLSGSGFKLASETDEANPNDSPGPKPEGATAIEYDLIAALIGGSADPGGEGTYTTTMGEADAAKTFDYCVIYPERCTVSEIERPTFGPHILTFDD